MFTPSGYVSLTSPTGRYCTYCRVRSDHIPSYLTRTLKLPASFIVSMRFRRWVGGNCRTGDGETRDIKVTRSTVSVNRSVPPMFRLHVGRHHARIKRGPKQGTSCVESPGDDNVDLGFELSLSRRRKSCESKYHTGNERLNRYKVSCSSSIYRLI